MADDGSTAAACSAWADRAIDAVAAGTAASADAVIAAALHEVEARALAWALKDACYAAWHESPVRAGHAAGALQALAARATGPQAAPVHSLATWTAGIAALAAGRLAEAADLLDRAHDGFIAEGDRQHAAQTRVPRMIALAMQGLDDDAQAAGQDALAQFVAAGDERSAGKVELNLGTMLTRRDRHADAAAMYRSAAVRFARVGDLAHSVMADLGLGQALTWQFQTEEALRIHHRAAMRAAAHGLALLRAQAQVAIGRLELHRGRHGDALAALVDACEAMPRIGAAPQQRLEAEAALADAYAALRLWPEAAAIHERVIAIADDAGAPLERARAQLERAVILGQLGEPDAALAGLAAAVDGFRALDNAPAAALARLHAGRIRLQRGELEAAGDDARAARDALAGSGMRGWWLQARLLEAQVSAVAGRRDDARREAEAVLAEAPDRPAVATAARQALAEVAAGAGDARAAREHAEAVLAAVEEARAALPGDEWRRGIGVDAEAAGDLLVRLALDDAGREAVQVLEAMRRGRARALALALDPAAAPAATSSLGTRLQWARERWREAAVGGAPDAATALEAEVRSLECEMLELHRRALAGNAPASPTASGEPDTPAAIRHALGDDTALVQFHRLGDRVAAVVVTRDGVELVELDATGLDARLQALGFQLEAPRLAPARLAVHREQLLSRVRHHLQALHAMLWAPLAHGLGGRRSVRLVPHRELHRVPWAALHDGSQWLVEQHALAIAPRLSVAAAKDAPAPTLHQVVIAGVGAATLQSVGREVEAVARALPGQALVLRDEQVTRDALRAAAMGADVLHLACHARFRDDNPEFSALALADGPLTLHELREWRLHAGLVVLAACETAASRLAPGDEALGLVRGFLIARAGQVLATRWQVNDASTADLMSDFYAALAAGRPAELALQGAQAAAARQGLHPFHWAAMTLHLPG